MIMALFWVIMALAITLVFLSYYTKESLYSLVGFGFIFVLGSWVLISGNLQIEQGYNKTTNYNYIPNSTLISSTSETQVITYSNFNDSTSHFLGFFILLLGAFGIVLSLSEVRRAFK